MQTPSFPVDEARRVAALHRLAILDTPPEERFDRITRTAQRFFAVPIALVSLVDTDRQWFKSCQGLPVRETGRDISFCGHAILGDDVLVIEDALQDPRFADNPLVTGEPRIRFYAGQPLRSRDGYRLGTLCLIDRLPRQFGAAERQALRDLAIWAQNELQALDLSVATGAILDNEARLRAVLDNVLEGVLTIDETGTLLSLNPAAEQIFGYESHRLVGQPFEQLLPESQRPLYRGYLRDYLQTGRAQNLGRVHEVAGVRRDGAEIPLELGVNVIRVDGQLQFIATVRDISARRQAEQLKNEFVAVVSHELRTPLTSIKGSLGLLASGVAGTLPPRARELIGIAHSNSERLTLLINDILDVEKIESGKLTLHIEPLALAPLVRKAVEANQAYGASREVAIALDEPLPDAQVAVDPARFEQVMANLLSNAVKYSPSGTAVRVGVDRHGDAWRVYVTDHGPGIPESFRTRIFGKFAQADSSDSRSRGGTGLGLNISKALVEHMGGRIGFESAPGRGATFFFDLPDAGAPDRSRPRPTASRVLVCEDDPDIARLLQALLRDRGYESDVAPSVARARRLLGERDYVALTLDILMPDQDGLDFLRELRAWEKTRRLPVVVVSVKAGEAQQRLNGSAFGVIDWLDKPIDEQRLIAAVQDSCGRTPGRRARILHVEDNTDVRTLVAGLLQPVADVQGASSLAEARTLVAQQRFDLAILDLNLPDGYGLELTAPLNRQDPPVPVIVFSGQEVRRRSDAGRLAAVLLKPATNNEQLLAVLTEQIARIPPTRD